MWFMTLLKRIQLNSQTFSQVELETSGPLQSWMTLMQAWQTDPCSDVTTKVLHVIILLLVNSYLELSPQSSNAKFREIIFKSKKREKVTASIRQNINRSTLI